MPCIMRPEDKYMHKHAKHCFMCCKKFSDFCHLDKVRDHCHLSGKFRYTLCSTRNLTCAKRPPEIHLFSHSLSNVPIAVSAITVCRPKKELGSPPMIYTGADCIEMLLQFIQSEVSRVSNILKNIYMPCIMRPEDKYMHKHAKHCFMCCKKFSDFCHLDKVRDHCHLSGKFRYTLYSTCNLTCAKRPPEIHLFSHSLSNVPIAVSAITVCRPKKELGSPPMIYTGADCIEVLLQFIQSEVSRVSNILKNIYMPCIMRPEDKYMHKHAKHCFMCCKKFSDFCHLDKVRDHCHLSGKFRYTLCSTCNLTCAKRPPEIHLFSHSLSNVPIAVSAITVCRPKKELGSPPMIYTGADCIEVFLQFIQSEVSRVSNILKNIYMPCIMRPEDKYMHKHAKHCFMCCKKFSDFCHLDKVRDHCHLSGKFRYTLCSTCNLTCAKRPPEIHLFSHSLSNVPIAASAITVCRPKKELGSPPMIYTGADCIEVFLQFIQSEVSRVSNILKNIYMPCIMRPEDKYMHKHAKHCFMCCKKFSDFCHLDKVRDHCHLLEKFRYTLCSTCNLTCAKRPPEIHLSSHSLSNYDSHFIIQKFYNFSSTEIKIIPKNTEKYLSFSVGCVHFKDSYQFLSKSFSAKFNGQRA